jgi:hypothetical protein
MVGMNYPPSPLTFVGRPRSGRSAFSSSRRDRRLLRRAGLVLSPFSFACSEVRSCPQACIGARGGSLPTDLLRKRGLRCAHTLNEGCFRPQQRAVMGRGRRRRSRVCRASPATRITRLGHTPRRRGTAASSARRRPRQRVFRCYQSKRRNPDGIPMARRTWVELAQASAGPASRYERSGPLAAESPALSEPSHESRTTAVAASAGAT